MPKSKQRGIIPGPRVIKHVLILLAALATTAVALNETGDWTGSLIKRVYRLMGGRAGVRFLLDEKGVPIVDYGYVDGVYVGQQRNPVTVAKKALAYHQSFEDGDKRCKRLFLNCADWLVNNAVRHHDYAVLPYDFPWPMYNMTPPWRSAMAQGLALQVLTKAHRLTENPKYLQTARLLLNLFYIEVKDGGVSYKSQDGGWWYEEYADEGGKESRVLNGMMFALMGIYDYYRYTHSTRAKYLFDQGVVALRRTLPLYDNGGYSYYDRLGLPAGKYHKVHIQLLKQLFEATGVGLFEKYRRRWERFEQLPFVVRLYRHPARLAVAAAVANFVVLLVAIELLALLFSRLLRPQARRHSGPDGAATG